MGFRRKHRGGGKGGGGGNQWMGFMVTVFGGVLLLISLIMFGIAIAQLDTSITSAGTYTEQVGVTSIMGIFGLVVFLVLTGSGLAAVTGGSVMTWKRTVGGGWMDVFLAFIMGTVSLVISLIVFGITQNQLHTAYVAANATVNKASFTGLLSIMGIFGVVFFLAYIGTGLSAIAAAGYGGYKNLKGGF